MSGPTRAVRRPAEVRDQLVEQYLPLVRYVVARLPVTMPATLDRDDFYSVGVMGLMHAANTYDPTRGASFKTFAYTAIRGAILDEVRKHDPVSRNRRDRIRRLERAHAELRARLDRAPTCNELAHELGIGTEDLDQDLQALHTCRTLSLDESLGPADEDGVTLAQRIECERTPDPSLGVLSREEADRLAKAISELPETDRHVVVLYFYERLYLKEIGRILGVTESRISQILTRALERLRLKLKVEED